MRFLIVTSGSISHIRTIIRTKFPDAQIFEARTEKRFKEALKKDWDVIITEYTLNWATGISILKKARETKPFTPIIMLIKKGAEEVAAEAMRFGLDDYVTSNDITRLPAVIKAAIQKEKARQREAMLSAIVENTKEAVISVDANGKIIYANKAMEEIFGWKTEELVGKHMSILAFDEEEQQRQWNKAIEKGWVKFETVRKDRNGNAIPVIMTVITFKDEFGNVVFSSAIMVDIRNIKDYQKKIEHLNELLLAIRSINQLITRERKEENLLHKVCKILYAIEEYELVCISYKKHAFWYGDEKLYTKIKELMDKNKIRWGKKLIDGKYAYTKIFGKKEKGKLCVVQSRNFDREEIELLGEVAEDISFALHSMQVEREKEKVEERYRMIVETVNEGISIEDRDEKMIYVNRAMAEALGYKEKELIGKSVLSLVYKEDKEKYRKEMKKRRSGKSSRYELRLIAKDGRVKTFLVSAVPLYEDGKFVGSLSINLDITEQIELEKKFEAIFEGAIDAIFIEDLDGNILAVNEAACRLLGYTKEELTRMNVRDIIPEEIESRFDELIEEHLKKGGTMIEAVNIDKNGRAIPVEVSTTLVEIGGKKRVVAIVRDITRRKKMEQQLKESEARYRSLVENLPLGIFIISLPDRAIVYLNEYGMNEILKREKGGVKLYEEYKKNGKINLDAAVSLFDIKGKTEGGVQKAIENKKIVNEVKTKGGKYLRIRLIPFEYGGKPAILGIASDITDLKKAEQKLKENIEYLQRFHDATVDRELKMVELKKKLKECEERWKKLKS